MLPGKSYAEAIIKIINNPDKWSFDCMQFVQVVNLFAMIDPNQKKSFDSRFGALKRIRKFPSQTEKPYESTGIKVKMAFQRHAYDSPMIEYPSGQKSSLSVAELLKKAPIGSRVTWHCLDASRENHTAGFSNENTIKMGENLYAGHPFYGEKGLMNKEEIELKLGKTIYPEAGDSFVREKIKTRIFICDISIFETPCA